MYSAGLPPQPKLGFSTKQCSKTRNKGVSDGRTSGYCGDGAATGSCGERRQRSLFLWKRKCLLMCQCSDQILYLCV
ncbi:hypothetical protein AAFF_G00042830 [Aldrovandia affinis]|uniref:Uncharacterized protein n=1 Tax=Aldrovandia affinis TaxID=143900 RepID=A0AAD7S2I2_9TELE|nr:hypothetical protein AAFF_G00042830 [Aldrovandia affinis]